MCITYYQFSELAEILALDNQSKQQQSGNSSLSCYVSDMKYLEKTHLVTHGQPGLSSTSEASTSTYGISGSTEIHVSNADVSGQMIL